MVAAALAPLRVHDSVTVVAARQEAAGRIMLSRLLAGAILVALSHSPVRAAPAAPALALNPQGYFARQGLNVMVFSDYYPDGHQTGVTVLQHGRPPQP